MSHGQALTLHFESYFGNIGRMSVELQILKPQLWAVMEPALSFLLCPRPLFCFLCVLTCLCDFVCVLVVPDAPRFFRINRRGFDTIHLDWDKPLEPNGILIGYQLKYQTGELL